MTKPYELTPADYADLQDERCRYVSRGKHELLLHSDGPNATGLLNCANPGCPVAAIHPAFVGRARTQGTRAQRVQHLPAPSPPPRGLPWLPILLAAAVIVALLGVGLGG